jgi:predicted Holliday junction resolvase-like endonuclease
LKRQLADDLALDIATFPFAAADARFLGNPVHYVVFDGHTEVKDRSADSLRGIVFLSVDDVTADSSRSGLRLVADCIKKGHVRWMTISMPQAGVRR